MSAQVLSARSTRRIARSTGLDVVRAWSYGGYVMAFVTSAHEHGTWDKKTGEWEWEQPPVRHFTSCVAMFGGC